MDISQHQILFFLLVVTLGFAGGFMAGMLGVGGGLVFVPVFQEIVRLHQVEADKVSYVLANSLLIVFVVGISGSIKQYKLKNTDIRSAVTTGLTAIFSSLVLTALLKYYDINDQALFSYIFSGILILTGIRMWMGKNSKKKETEDLKIPPAMKFIPAGFIAGIITAFTGLGGGVIMIPYFNKILKLPIKFATGLSLTVIPIIAFPLLLFYGFSAPEQEYFKNWQTGFILWPAVLPMLIAAGLASPLGVKAAHKMSSNTLLAVFLLFIFVNIIKILVF